MPSTEGDGDKPVGPEPLRKGTKIWSHVRKVWLDETPEERVRQEYLVVLVNEYGYSLAQIGEEVQATGKRGTGSARADFVIWATKQDRLDHKNPLIIVETKSDNVTIRPDDYTQGDNYARLTGAKFVVTHNSRETRYWRVIHDRMPKHLDEIEGIPHANATDEAIKAIIARLKVFKENEFAALLHDCHNVIRNRDKKDPTAAFDEIAKILFVKVAVERERRANRLRENLFTVQVLDEQKFVSHPVDAMFQKTKHDYKDQNIFAGDEKIELKAATAREVVRLLEKYNLSDTSEDIKGIAFERFLGRTFRGEIGQFFTPRSIVEFMIQMVEPKEGDRICDPASGSGGFLIRFFEIVRQMILQDVDRQYQAYKTSVDKQLLPQSKKAAMLREKFDELQLTIDQTQEGTRLWMLANRCIYGCDANDRMARTSKMNMIMHGDGHGGVHHRDGFLDLNGIFDGRFDIVLTNPPFGSSVEADDVVHKDDVPELSKLQMKEMVDLYGEGYAAAHARLKAAIDQPITSLFTLHRGEEPKVRTEILFIERCLNLLRDGGRLGIVLPEGIFNNPTLEYVREFCEDRAQIMAIESLPQDTFVSSKATVKASLLFLRKFTAEERNSFEQCRADAIREIEEKYAAEIATEQKRVAKAVAAAKVAGEGEKVKALRKELVAYLREMTTTKRIESRQRLKEEFDYAIFLAEAERVGITATGDDDQNELVPGDLPPGVNESVLESYLRFKEGPESFAFPGPPHD